MASNNSSNNSSNNETEQIGASYLNSFYVNIQYMTEWVSSYMNLIIELQAKYGGQFEGLDDEDRVNIVKHLQNIRHYATLCHFQYNSVMMTMKKKGVKKEEKIIELYKVMMNEQKTMIEAETVREYTQLFHDFLANNNVDELMTTSKDLLDELTRNN